MMPGALNPVQEDQAREGLEPLGDSSEDKRSPNATIATRENQSSGMFPGAPNPVQEDQAREGLELALGNSSENQRSPNATIATRVNQSSRMMPEAPNPVQEDQAREGLEHELLKRRKDKLTPLQILNITDDVGKCWHDLGIQLNIQPVSKVENLEQDYRFVKERARKVLYMWIEQYGKDATVGRLAFALIAINQRGIAEKLLGQIPHYEDTKSREPQQAATPEAPMNIIPDLHKLYSDQEKVNKKTDLSEDDQEKVNKKTDLSEELQKIAAEKGFIINDNPPGGNCMFYALSEQLLRVKGIQISNKELRNTLVEFLEKSPFLPNGTHLFNFVNDYPSWTDYLSSMKEDGTWGDHLILCAAANCYKTCIRVVSSLNCEVVITPDNFIVDNTKPLVLGHIHEYHYVGLSRQGKGSKETTEQIDKLREKYGRFLKEKTKEFQEKCRSLEYEIKIYKDLINTLHSELKKERGRNSRE